MKKNCKPNKFYATTSSINKDIDLKNCVKLKKNDFRFFIQFYILLDICLIAI